MQIKKLLGLLLLIDALTLAGCAEIAFYDNKELLEPKTGVKFYYPKPYLLVAQPDNKDKPVEVSVIYLPDLKNPAWAKPKYGYGSADLSLSFQNGIITSVGQKTDTKIPETITAITGMAQSAAALATVVKKSDKGNGYRVTTDYQRQLKHIAKTLDTIFKEARRDITLLAPGEVTALGEIKILIQDASSLEPDKSGSNQQNVVNYLNQSLDKWKAIGDGTDRRRNTIQQCRIEIQQIRDQLTPKPEKPIFKLYEIDNSDGKTVLKEVDTSKINIAP